VVPAVIVASLSGMVGVDKLLVGSRVVLSLKLPSPSFRWRRLRATAQ
jgi:hypothetical protein